MSPHAKHLNNKQGFTLAEVILVVAVIAILVSLTAAPVIEFMKMRDIRSEENEMNEIMKAANAYLEDRNELPADTGGTWADELARYTSLSADQIANDTWGNPRMYVMHKINETFLGTPIEVYYVTLHSAGPNRKADGGAASAGGDPVSNSGIATGSDVFSAVTDTGWWKNKTTDTLRVQAFVDAQPAMDDMMVRLTDYPEKIQKYKTSLERLQRISEALEGYATSRYNETVVACMSTTCSPLPEQLIYYPPSANSGPSTYYAGNVNADITTYNGGSMIDNSTNDANRRDGMINLMRILGLPDEYCCNALKSITGSKNEVPFYYFSNPRPRLGSGTCGNRPNPQSTNPALSRTLPARIAVSDAGTCG
ncbi:MAG: prepilin-type N-terminal cleavage/methylation domain-containing protein [Pseudomonadaceae bacterium]|nr:prepilin-type N-terminal cleavage/methylation domain-containing protein [Pseudomonadaceae bacterium]